MPKDEIHVAVAVITNSRKEVLISLRPEDAHQGGLWEFPGGKVEPGESTLEALKREISEELDIEVIKASPFKIIRHSYSDKSVVLDIWKIDAYTGDPVGAEGQLVKWQPINQLDSVDFPKANRSIIQALKLPDRYMITGAYDSDEEFIEKLERSLQNGISLVQMRCKNLAEEKYLHMAEKAQWVCNQYNAQLLLNTSVSIFMQSHAQGLHLTGRQLNQIETRPISDSYMLSVSCHTQGDIKKARQLNADLILLSPVKETTSHPGVKGIGWVFFKKLIENIDTPVYALGGMTVDDLADAKLNGAQGIAAISSFWLS